ncbi:MAG: amidohydrolase family protein [Cytophagales bacterium]|nr:amidohydrolase family protein [Cytophagales bacterium]
MNFRFRWTALLLVLSSGWLYGQDDTELAPVSRTYALTNVNIIQAPGRKIDMGTVVIKNGLIVAVGKSIAVPSDAIVIKADSMYVYAGFIDGLSRAGVTKPKEETRERVKDPGNPPPDRAGVTPYVEVRGSINPADKSLEELRNTGFTTVQIVPHGNLLPGQAAIILSGGSSAEGMLLANKSALYSELTGANNVYPATILGVMAKWRELYRQASQAKAYEGLYASNRSGIERPQSDRILEAFYPVIDQRMPVVIKTEKLLDVYRAITLKTELNFPLMLADIKEGWPGINKIKASGAKVFLSLDLPEETKKEAKKEEKADAKKEEKADANKEVKADAKKEEKPKTAADIEKEGLDKRKEEAIANYTGQAASFQKAGVPFGFSSISVKPKDIPANLRRMIAAGLTEDAALAALTTSPAQMLGLSDRMGTIDNGKMANLVISDKPYFNERSKVRYVFVDGVMYKMEVKETKKGDPNAKVEIEGSWSTVTQAPQGNAEGKLTFKKDGGNYSGTVSGGRLPAPVDLTSVSLDGNVLTFKYTMTFGTNSITVSGEATVEGDSFKGTLSFGQNRTSSVEGTRDPKN